MLSLADVADEITRRLCRIFLPDRHGHRPVLGTEPGPRRPAFREYLLFYEYFHGDDGHGLGASHQTGWTGLIAPLLQIRAAAQKATGQSRRREALRPIAAGE